MYETKHQDFERFEDHFLIAVFDVFSGVDFIWFGYFNNAVCFIFFIDIF